MRHIREIQSTLKMKRKTNFKYKSVISGVASGIHPSIVSHFNDNILREMKIIIPNKSFKEFSIIFCITNEMKTWK